MCLLGHRAVAPRRDAPDKNLREKPKDVDWVICNGCMVSREMLLKVGMFDENFWQCNEDVDWSYRIRKNGFRVVYVDRAAILHKGGSSGQSGHKWVFSYGYFIGRNAFTFGWKYGTVPQKIKLFLLLWTGLLGRIAFYALDNTKHAILGQRYFVRGILDGLRGQLSRDYILVKQGPPRGKDARQGYPGRIKRWMGV